MTSRRFRSYCVGTGKTGTHSLAGMLERHYRSAHEPDSEALIRTILDGNGVDGWPSARMQSFLLDRDRRLFLELESDGTLHCFVESIVREFEDAKFILTIRDCYSWLDSVFNHNISRQPGGLWRAFDDYTFSRWTFSHARQEDILERQGLRTLSHYLCHWAVHNESIIDMVPSDRLLVLRTDKISASNSQLADFLGIAPDTIDLSQSRLFVNPHRYDLLDHVDRAFLEDKVHELCGPLMHRFFPEITGYRTSR